MKLITNFTSITNAYNFAKGFKKGFITNCFITREKFNRIINNGKLFEIIIDDVVFFLKKENDFWNLYYYSASMESLSNTLPILLKNINENTIIVDLITKSELCSEKIIFETNKFSIYTSLVRMSSSLASMKREEVIKEKKIRSAKIGDAAIIVGLLNNYFDPRAEQLPDLEDIISWIEDESIILFEENKKIIGFIIYDLKGITLFLRYWFVDPLYRDLKIGSKLFSEFLNRGKDSQRQLFWVIRSNENAIKRYLHYGFVEEKMYNYVLINNNEKYGD